MSKILIGYINKFIHLSDAAKDALSGLPKQGSIYRIIHTDNKSELSASPADTNAMYQIYIGAENNKGRMDTIFLGNGDSRTGDTRLEGKYYDKWEFDISFITKDNYLEFNFKEEELPTLKKWLDSDNNDLSDILRKTPFPVDVNTLSSTPPPPPEIANTIQTALSKVINSEMEYEKSLAKLSKAVNTIIGNDMPLTAVLAELLVYIASTYKDKYEAANKTNMARDFLVTSKSSDTAVFNSLKYLQRYSTTGFSKSGKIVDVHKAIHYLLFELQRQKNLKDNDK